MRIQTFLYLVLSGFVVAAILMAAIFTEGRWQTYVSSDRLLSSIDTYTAALRVAEKLSFERGPMNSVLGAGPPVPAEYSVKLATARSQTDTAISTLRAILKSSAEAENQQTFDDLTAIETSLSAARQEIDRLALVRKADRPAGSVAHVVNLMFSVVDRNAFTLNQLELSVPRSDPAIVQLISVARQASDLREFAGRIGSTLAAPITEGRPYSQAESLKAERIYGKLVTLTEQLKFATDHLPQEKALPESVAAMQRSYIQQGIPLVNRLITVARGDGRYDMSMGTFTSAYVPTMTSIVAVRDTALASAVSKATQTRSLALTFLILCLAMTAIFTLAVLGLAVFFSRYYVRPLIDQTRDIQRLAAGESSLKPKLIDRTDEIGDLSAAIRQLVDHTVLTESVMKKLVEEKMLATKASEDKSQFLAHMSHELRTPLNAIIGFSDLMRSPAARTDASAGTGKTAKFAEYADDIHDSAIHLLSLITDILDISKIEAGKMEIMLEEIDIAQMAQDCARLMAIRAAAGQVTVGLDLELDLPPLCSDARRLKQALLNLLSNAVKFTKPGGKVTISTHSLDDGGISIRVTDTGIGMTAEEIRKALEPYGQIQRMTSASQEGTGLGLPLCKLLVEHLGGTLSLRSKPHEETVAIIDMPGRSLQSARA